MNIRPFKPKFETKPSKFGNLRLIPLGGVGDVTKNMYVYEYGQDIIIVDCGIGFPDEDMPGIDLVIPDVSYLKDKKHMIRGIIVTHPHDDHIGGLPYIWPELRCPIFAQRLAAGFIKNKFNEAKLPKDSIKNVDLSTQLKLGVFNVSFYGVSHSVPDATGLVIETPVGRIIHQADFKLDWTPVVGNPTEVGKIAQVGDKGVLLMLSDALRAEKQGYNLSEKTIQPAFERIESATLGKVLITTASSNIGRIQQAINVAVGAGRKVALIGRSMDGNFQVARDLGYLDIPPGLIIAADEIRRFPDNKLLLIIAGSQGQPGSALSRVANSDHKFVVLKKDDAVVFSADPIPSSESAQHALIDKLSKFGANVHYTALGDALHISGHAAAEELKVMINLVRPKYLIPIGATFRQMKAFSNLVQEMGWGEDKVLLLEDGQIVNISPGKVEANGRIETRNIYIDGLGIGDVGNIVLRDRKVMAEEGIVLVVVPVDARTSQLAGEPDIVSRGFVFEKESEGLLNGAKNVVKSVLADHPDSILDWRFTRRHIEENLERYFYEETQRRPMVLPVIVEV